MPDKAVRSLVVDHPVVAHRLGTLRDARTDNETFRRLIADVSTFVAYEALRDLRTVDGPVDTPVVVGARRRRVEEMVLVVPILRAGLSEWSPPCRASYRSVRSHMSAFVGTRSRSSPRCTSLSVACRPERSEGGGLRSDAGNGRFDGCGVRHDRPTRGARGRRTVCPGLGSGGSNAWVVSTQPCGWRARLSILQLDERGFIVPGLGDAGDRLFGPAH